MSTFVQSQARQLQADVVIIGAGISGIQAACVLCAQGKRVILSEECAWLGSQFTSQAVPPDEHPWIEEDFGANPSYLSFRRSVRSFYAETLGISKASRDNPAAAGVTRLGADPKVFLHELQALLQPGLASGLLTLLQPYFPVRAELKGHRILSVLLEHKNSGCVCLVQAPWFIDASEWGELLPLSATAYRTGMESRAQSGEPEAPEAGDPQDMQPVTWVLALERYSPGSKAQPIPKPADYDYWQALRQPYDNYPVLSWYGPDGGTGKARRFCLDPSDQAYEGYGDSYPLWPYRRTRYPTNYAGQYGRAAKDIPEISLLNWPQNDYFLGNLIENPRSSEHKAAAKSLSLALAYWLQQEALRPDGGRGYAEIGIAFDALGTADGFAQHAYVREGRRIVAEKQVLSSDLLQAGGARYEDSIGIGSYHLDFHITTGSHHFGFRACPPYQVPLGALLPLKTENLLAAGKNIGTSHWSNSCFRLHPVEWAVGEAAGHYAAFLIDIGALNVRQGRKKEYLKTFLAILDQQGILRHWPEQVFKQER